MISSYIYRLNRINTSKNINIIFKKLPLLKSYLIPTLSGQTFTFRIAVLQKCFEIYVNDNIYGTFEFVKFPKQIQYAMIYGDFEKITQFHHRMLFPLVFPKGLICAEKIAFQSDVPRKYEAGEFNSKVVSSF